MKKEDRMTREKRFCGGVLLSLIMILSMDQAGYGQTGVINFNQSKWTSLIGQKLYHGGPSNTLTDTENGVEFIVTYGSMNITAGYPTGGMLFFSPIIAAGNNDESGQVSIRFSALKTRVKLQVSHDEHPVHTPYYTVVKFYRDHTPSNPLQTVDVPWNSGAFSNVEYSNSSAGIMMVVVTTMFAENNIDNIEFDAMETSLPEGTFAFNDGTAQGWTMQGAFNEAGQGPHANNFAFGWKDQVDFPDAPGKDPAGDGHGSVQISTSSSHGISDAGRTWFVMQFHSPDLSSLSDWRNAKGYTLEIAECMIASGTMYQNLFVKVFDLDQARDRTFYSGEAAALLHDTYGDATGTWNHLRFDWSAMSGFPARYTVKEIFINIWGRLGNSFNGGVYLDNVAPIPGEAQPQTPAAPTNLVAVQLPTQIHVTWQDNSSDETGFKLEMKESPTFPGTWQDLAILGPDVTSYQMDGLRFNHTYYFRVSAFNANGSSAASNTDTLYCGYQLVWLEVTRPNGGETWNAGGTQAVTWQSSTLQKPERVNIYYSTDGGSHWIFPPVASNIPNLGTFNWTVPATLSSDCLVKVENAEGAMPYDLSNMAFRILEGSGPVLSVSEDTLDFGTDQDSRTFEIGNTGNGTLSWNIEQDPQKPWVTSVDPPGGTNNAVVTVRVDRGQVSGDGDTGGLSIGSNGGDGHVVLRIAKQEHPLPANWTFTAGTGNNATVILPVSANPNINGHNLAHGDYIGAFTPSGLCCGWSQWGEANLSITAWGDDSQSPETDGFSPGERIQYGVYRSTTQTEWKSVTTGYSMGTGLYSADGLMILNKFDVSSMVSLGIQFSIGWNMFSVNLAPVPPDLISVMAPVQDDLVIVKNGQGKTYIPEFQINDIGDVDFRQGYKAYLKRGPGLVVQGTPVNPSTPINLLSGWNMIGFLPNLSIPVETALAGIGDRLVIAKNNHGGAYIPEYGINTLVTMSPGQGYQVYLSSAGTLVYPTGGFPKVTAPSPGIARPGTAGHFQFVAGTGENATVIVPLEAGPRFSNGAALAAGDEIGVFTAAGRCCGAIAWEEKNAAITVWGDNAVTDSVDGFLSGDTLRLRVWKTSVDKEYPADVDFRDGDPAVYVQDGISVVTSLVADLTSAVAEREGKGIPADCGLSGNYPNPFNSQTVIEYRIPAASDVELTVYDLNGRPVRSLVRGVKPAGYYQVQWDGTDDGGMAAASGIYYYRVRMTGKESGGFSFKTGRKMILIR
jgi:hypothetical protein